ncbi:anti-sigma factor [Pedobacter sp. HMWF019]|uniref:FecR family protein n=1 Tax=Pedobacter sp. HMWF019 TaxID=2056856 RepID=UPI000D3A0A7D|nr:FecR domain-containing protein [Pedobacter sp. HMWF019]PTS99334.1 anti-sigma factor [Pedobacter sp. HMWF019]
MEEQEVQYSFRIAGLITRYMNNSLDPLQQEELMQWINDDPANESLFKKLNSRDGRDHYLNGLNSFPAVNALVRVKDRIHGTSKVLKMRRRKQKWVYASVAAVLLLISIASWFVVENKTNDDELRYATESISPGRTVATLTLSNGKKITLDSIANGRFAEQSGVSISKTKDGNLVYQFSEQRTGVDNDQFNSIETPKGGTYQINLPDGTKVWLNAASLLRFPVRFSQKERRVELAGEGYFEVAKDKSRPFFVKNNTQEVKVLGTHFNINGYSDNTFVQTTLIEGSVQVSSFQEASDIEHVVLRPGQQSELNSGNFIVKPANIQEVMAWKNGNFLFDAMELSNILKQLNRWYNINVDYSGVPNLRLTGYISRNESLYRVLQMLEITANVKFKVQNKVLKTSIKK